MCYTLKLTKEEQWRKAPWNRFDKQIRKIQERIYDASVRNDSKSVRTLQKVLVGKSVILFFFFCNFEVVFINTLQPK